ncbi:MAG: signal peptidase II [Bacteroidia bacterium]|nr:signal peptidase II [Bacteroidia bacterium]NND24416.1 signal peptidase II [Flavobacteriaceae bacterium]MBT8277576.1 signal peptidase II [Bacteroidia bacterium]NNK59897.1 signal peptidase II [Flavobacteriaceae bacterium]NNL32765.1 signal peptidase II [Flavobacteriaceae bacterium]
MKLSKRSMFITGLILANIALDQISKFWVRANVATRSESEIWTEKFILTNVENSGAFLGLGSDLNQTLKIILLLVLPVLVLGFVLRHVLKDKAMDRMSLIGYCCIIGGGIANVYDRFVYGSVTDFLHIDLGGVFRTGIFNIADVSVTTGLIMLIVASFIYKKPKVTETEKP